MKKKNSPTLLATELPWAYDLVDNSFSTMQQHMQASIINNSKLESVPKMLARNAKEASENNTTPT